MTRSAPRSRTHSRLLVPVVVVTVAPRCLASWIAKAPTPPDPAWTSTLWPGCRFARSTSACQAVRAKGHRGRLGHGEVGGLDREVVLVHGDALGEGADAAVARSRVDLVAHGEARHGRPDAGDDTGEVVAEEEWRLVGEEQLELAVADLCVKHVHAGRVDLDQHVVVADRRLRDLAELHRTPVPADQVGLHDRALSEGSGRGSGSRLRGTREPA